MTNKEAINILKRGYPDINRYAASELKAYEYSVDIYNEALSLAIKALMAYRDCKHCTHNIKVGNMRGCALWDCDFEDARGIKE